ncbi:uncharacterized protein [Parasteatoda tepidariorum]|uniref:uncharacterized protein isoform X2 n=1 Tax=Parasteatoda tepidariorum TaxID=114398 RepID=UPI0039BC45CB
MWKVFLLLSVLLPFANCSCKGCSGYTQVDASDNAVIEAAVQATKTFSGQHFSKFHLKVLAILDGNQSVCLDEPLCGKTASYQLEVSLGLTNCLKTEMSYETAQDCDSSDSSWICKLIIQKGRKGQFLSTSSSCRA